MTSYRRNRDHPEPIWWSRAPVKHQRLLIRPEKVFRQTWIQHWDETDDDTTEEITDYVKHKYGKE